MDKFLNIAISEAEKSFENGDYPVGAVLTIDGELVGSKNNSGESTQNYSNHAETQLVLDNAGRLLQAWKDKKRVVLYSTLEPCLMCLGVAVMNKVSKIVFLQHDPHAGACGLDIGSLGIRYKENFPIIEYINSSERPRELIVQFLKKQIEDNIKVEWSSNMLTYFEKK